MAAIRDKYPPPDYNPHTDGSWNPATDVIDFHLKCSKKQLRKLCKKHALDHVGSKRKLMKRMYLHWRSAKFFLQGEGRGKEYYGYGKGYEAVRKPDCPCGYILVADWEKLQQKKEDRRLINKRLRADLKVKIRRFPRLAKGFHFRFPR